MSTALTSAPAAIRDLAPREIVRLSDLPGSRDASRKAASRAVAAGELARVRKGIYMKVPESRYGAPAPESEEVAKVALGGAGVGPTGFSAARTWGVTTQVPSQLHVAALKTLAPLPGVAQHHRSNLGRVNLKWEEIALLELMRTPDVHVEAGWDVLVEHVSDALSSKEINANKLRDAVTGERSRAIADRLVSLLTEAERRSTADAI